MCVGNVVCTFYRYTIFMNFAFIRSVKRLTWFTAKTHWLQLNHKIGYEIFHILLFYMQMSFIVCKMLYKFVQRKNKVLPHSHKRICVYVYCWQLNGRATCALNICVLYFVTSNTQTFAVNCKYQLFAWRCHSG